MKPGFVRIIGGKWRGRKVKIANCEALRPTPDRVRETLFNWLAPYVVDSHCLDLFAGTGVLGFEALSRGARKVTFIEQSTIIIDQLLQSAHELNVVDQTLILPGLFPNKLPQLNEQFDIVFIDPPYHQELVVPSCFYLADQGLLSPHAHLFLEAERAITQTELPPNWQLIKQKKAGVVFYHLAQASS